MENINKEGITDEERQALAAKLDADLDAFINSLEKKKYTDGWKPEEFEKVKIDFCESHVENFKVNTESHFRRLKGIRSS